MTDAPAPTARTNEPTQASFLPPLAITGASGNVGGVVARLLSERGLPLRLLANTPSRAPKLPGAHTIQCSYEDTPASREALTGVDVLFMVSAPESEDRLNKHIAFVDAAAASGVRHIVYLSFMNAAPDATFTLARTHFHTEERIKASGMTYTFLRDNFYADFFVALPDEEGHILGPAGDGRVGVVAREDAGRVAAEVLANPRSFENQTLDVTGPEALTLDEITRILTRVWGRPVTYVRETVEEAYESRKKWPAAQWQYDSWVSTYTSIACGEMDVVSTTVRDVTGRDPLTFEEVARAADAGRTILLSSHILAEVQRVCSAVTIIKNGRVVENGDLETLRRLSRTRIEVRAHADQLDALVRALTDAGVGARRDRGRLEVQVAADRVPRVLAAVAEQRVTDVTCEAASLEDLFLRHYEDVR